jgi:hypothetical protein
MHGAGVLGVQHAHSKHIREHLFYVRQGKATHDKAAISSQQTLTQNMVYITHDRRQATDMAP